MAELIELVTAVANPGDRNLAARALAYHFGAEGAIFFVMDGELDIPLPVLGFPQTLPRTGDWRSLIRRSFSEGFAEGEILLPESDTRLRAKAVANKCAAVFWPGENVGDLEPIRAYLPLLHMVYGQERENLAMRGQLTIASTTAKEVNSLARELDVARMHLEQRVHERTAELRASIRELEGFTYSVAHDLRAPLRAIYSTGRILQEEFRERLPPEAHDLLDIQAERAMTLATLIDDLLQLSRLARSELVRKTIDLTTLSVEITSSIVQRMPEKAKTYEFNIQPGMSVRGDLSLIKLAMQNLIENAVKFSPSGGNISISESSGTISISDDGIGFDPKYKTKIFGAFERLVTADEFPGTGIGLANVRRIAERHGGQVWAESALGRGTTISMTLGPSKDVVDPATALE